MTKRHSLLLAFVVLLAALVVILLATVPVQLHAQVASIRLTWTAPGDDSLSGTATSYDVRYSSARPDTASATAKASWWASASQASGEPAPLAPGSLQSFDVAPTGGFLTGRVYWFVIRTTDDAGNQSGWSNVASKSLPDSIAPAPILDLRAQ
jgi:hypothetical protein